MHHNPAPPTKAEQTTSNQSVTATALYDNAIYIYIYFIHTSGADVVPQSKASIYDNLLDTLKLLEEDPEPLKQSEKVRPTCI